ncbi:MAG: CopG family ribbon-helix-helix protein [Bacilli bacterium]
MKNVTMTVRIPAEIKDRLEALSEATDRSKAYLAAQAIEEFIEVQEWQIKAIQEGVQAANRGEFESGEKVKATFKKWGAHVDH